MSDDHSAEPKQSSKLLIFDTKQRLYCIYRAPGNWSNADTISFLGADGDQIDQIVVEAAKKVCLLSTPADWCRTVAVDNPANHEINVVWTLGRPVDELTFKSEFYGGIMCLPPRDMWTWRHMLSPAALSIMSALPDIFSHPPDS